MAGCLYTKLFYPGYISLHSGLWFTFIVDGKHVGVLVRRHVESLKINDFGNHLQILHKDDHSIETSLEKSIDRKLNANICATYNLANGIDRQIAIDNLETEYRYFYQSPYTELCIVYDIEDTDNISEEEEQFHVEALKIFLDSYRIVSKDVRIQQLNSITQEKLVVFQGFADYLAEEVNESPPKRLTKNRKINLGVKLVCVADWTESAPSSTSEIERFSIELRDRLNQNAKAFPEEYWLLKAYEELVIRKNAKYALLEAFIAAESAIRNALTSLKLSKGVSKGKLDNYANEIGIGYMINIELPMLIENITDHERKLLGEVDRIRKLRNSIMHTASTVNDNEAGKALNAIHSMIKMLYYRGII